MNAASLLAPTAVWIPCDPVTVQHLEWLHTHLDFEDPFNATVFTIACLAFWLQAQLREPLFDAAFDPRLHISCNSIKFSVASSNRGYGKGWLPHMKTKSHSHWLLFMDSKCTNSVCHALKWHLSSNSLVPETTPLFTFETLNGSWRLM